jgi:hypothetical protein
MLMVSFRGVPAIFDARAAPDRAKVELPKWPGRIRHFLSIAPPVVAHAQTRPQHFGARSRAGRLPKGLFSMLEQFLVVLVVS